MNFKIGTRFAVEVDAITTTQRKTFELQTQENRTQGNGAIKKLGRSTFRLLINLLGNTGSYNSLLFVIFIATYLHENKDLFTELLNLNIEIKISLYYKFKNLRL